jgi:pantoate--beta-alanine ligase
MRIIETKAEMLAYSRAEQDIGFVPTMGYLHEGHLSLVRRAKAENKRVVVSVFVNPAQFNDPADFEKYPVDLGRDTKLLEAEGVDAVFLPSRQEVYPHGVPLLTLRYEALMGRLCGAFRPGHFEGVLLIVHNLFMWVAPARAYFGLKDYQQCLLIQKMARDLELPVEVVGCPLVRENDGLALSSRNVRLSPAGRKEALKISQALLKAKRDFSRYTQDLPFLKNQLTNDLKPLEVEYASFYDAHTLEELEDFNKVKPQVLIAVAAFVEGVRLIDNILIH